MSAAGAFPPLTPRQARAYHDRVGGRSGLLLPEPAPRHLLLRIAAFVIALCVSAPVFALDPGRTLSQYVHRIWQVQQGLPQASIYAIVQTHDGYLWLGTQTALVKFDGVRFTTLEQLDGVSFLDLWVTNLVEDEEGSLWIGTNHSGLIRVRNGKVTRFTEHEGLPSDTVQCLFNDRRNNLWVCTPNGLAEVTREKIRVFGSDQGLPTRDVQAACVMPNGTLYVGSEGPQIAAWDGSQFRPRRLDLPEESTVGAMLCTADDVLWVGTNDGLMRIHGEHQDRLSRSDGLADDAVLTLTASRDGSVFVGTKKGFSRIRGREIESIRPEDGLSQSTVYSLYEDREGSLWAATKHGLNQFFDGRAIPYTTREGLPSNNTGPVFEDRHGTIWIGTLGGGLARFDRRRFATLTTRDGLASDTIHALAEDSAGDLLIGTDAGLNRLHAGIIVETWTMAQGLPDNRVRALYRDAHGAIWIATPQGVGVIRDGVLRKQTALETTVNPILAFGEDRDGKLHAVPALDPPSLHAADALYRDSEGSLWVGTLGEGLRLIDGDRIVNFSVLDGLFDDVIYGIAEDDEGRLWMACSKGIFSVSKAELRAFAAGTTHSVESTPYSPLDGLRTIECQAGVQPAVSRMRDGRLWFSTIRGVLVLDPKNLERRFVTPAVAIEDVIVDGARRPTGDPGTLVAGRNNVEFGYTGVTFIAPTRVTFRYMLEGFNNGWIDAGINRQAFYSNLPPGRFRFRVTACSPDGACSEASHPVAFTIEPRVYQRAWFFPGCGVLLALGAWAVYQLRIRRLKEEFNLILAERGRIARELHDTLIQGFSGITMAMQALVSHLPASDVRHELEDIVADAGSSLKEARRSLAGLRRHDSQSGLAAAVATAARQLTEAKDVRLKLDLDECNRPLPADVEYNLLRIAQEAVLNAVKHSGARTLQVTLDSTSQHLRLSVHDDGSGFDEAGSPPVGHYGLIGMKERAAQIGADFQLATARGRGTTVEVLVEA
jgi:ligand-binding sensor domain-containing protein